MKRCELVPFTENRRTTIYFRDTKKGGKPIKGILLKDSPSGAKNETCVSIYDKRINVVEGTGLTIFRITLGRGVYNPRYPLPRSTSSPVSGNISSPLLSDVSINLSRYFVQVWNTERISTTAKDWSGRTRERPHTSEGLVYQKPTWPGVRNKSGTRTLTYSQLLKSIITSNLVEDPGFSPGYASRQKKSEDDGTTVWTSLWIGVLTRVPLSLSDPSVSRSAPKLSTLRSRVSNKKSLNRENPRRSSVPQNIELFSPVSTKKKKLIFYKIPLNVVRQRPNTLN